MKLAYFINQYPKVSHTFVRREILAHEAAGCPVIRYALRGWDAEVVDPLDQVERERTRFVLQRGLGPLMQAFLRALGRRPKLLGAAIHVAFQQWRGGDRSIAHNLVSVAEACLLREWCEQDGVEHLHAHFGTNSALIARMTHALGGPGYSFTVHGPDEFDSPRQLGIAEKIASAQFVAAISHFTRAQLQRWARYEDAEKIHVVRCGLDAAFLDQPTVPPPDSPRLLCIGRLCPAKGQLMLVEVIGSLVERGREVQLVLAGDGEDRPAIEAAIASHKLQDHVRLLGWVDEARVRDELAACRALILPSRMEGLPMVLMEALALRRPVISTYVAGIPELVAASNAGWLVPAGDRSLLAAAIESCLDLSTDELTDMADRGRQAVTERHDVNTEAARLRSLIEQNR